MDDAPSRKPWEAFHPDGVIVFYDMLTPRPAFGLPFDIENVRGPVIQSPIVSEEGLKTLHPIDLRQEVGRHAAVLGFVGAPWTIATCIVEGGSTPTYTRIKSMCHITPQGHEDKFTVYVHASKQKPVHSEQLVWGKFSTVEAEKRLLANALLDPDNQHFVLLSDSCIPLHNFDYVYNYLVYTNISCINCFVDPGPQGTGRYSEHMLPEVEKKDFRKRSQDEIKKMRDEIREKLNQEVLEGTAPDFIQVPLDAEFGIMREKLGRRGRSIHGVGVFPRMETSSSSTFSSMASSSELSAIYDQLKMLSTNFVTLQKDNEDLRAQLRSVLTASHGQTSTSSRGSNGVHSDDYYDELANHNLDEN